MKNAKVFKGFLFRKVIIVARLTCLELQFRTIDTSLGKNETVLLQSHP